ncbi:ATP-dependent DNA helicase RecQ [Planctomycetes bacterium Pan216]|uniref:ATP-dependent DNA helicase RecQ n=1 Tax=Kolteria novifilia TaxID=2527975 RepID=A0A518B383_9BACT|nr:ATP-dependent DNA helicase RecQ [Planctomycetes bacterium Pan216]
MVSAPSGPIDELLPRFGLSTFRPGQREVIETVLGGRDVLCVMPTGGGKSLCYQLPALLQSPALVVSPLIALMKDQEDQLARLGIQATSLHSGLDPAERQQRLSGIREGAFDLIYVAPERLRSERFREMLGGLDISLLAIDEAHCISEWGHDFRPDYARLGYVRRQLGDPTTIALTATATDAVRRDIATQLDLHDPAVFIRGFDRPNLHYGVTAAATKAQKLTRLRAVVHETPGSIIVYASSRKSCEEVAAHLRERCGRKVGVYHAGLMANDRRQAQDHFMSGRSDIIVATNAFGMGIDKPDIRAVLHHNIPGTLEAYYQEAGRAGRDGQPARCELLFSMADRMIQEFFIENEYPERRVIYDVLDVLRSQGQELVEWTRSQICERLNGGVAEMAVGTALRLLESAGVVERLRPRENLATITIHESGPDLTDLLPANAKTQRAVLRFLQGLVGDRRGQECYFRPEQAAAALEIDRSSMVAAIGELRSRLDIDYVPPFRGSATRVLDLTTPAESLPIDFEELERRRQREYEKLDEVIAYATSRDCRRQHILGYFGERSDACGHCDQCDMVGGSRRTSGSAFEGDAGIAMDDRSRAVLVAVLEGAAELRGRFGKGRLAETLTGSKSKQIEKAGLSRKQCFGKLLEFQQRDVITMVEALLQAGALEQSGDRLRPTVKLNAQGAAMLRDAGLLPSRLPLPRELWAKMAQCISVPLSAGMGEGTNTSASREESAAEVSAKSSTSPATPTEESGRVPDEHWTCRLLEAGFSISECALIRRMTADRVLADALRAARRGVGVPWEPFEDYPFESDLMAQVEELRRCLAVR